jgi:hypothetical protein
LGKQEVGIIATLNARTVGVVTEIRARSFENHARPASVLCDQAFIITLVYAKLISVIVAVKPPLGTS